MCTSPITIRYTNIHTLATRFRSIQVPCGKCCECKKRYQNDWSLRMNEELKAYGYKATFVTFTYNNDSVPKVVDKETGAIYLSVNKKHIQNALKRFRTGYKRANGVNLDFSYFITSEYGPRTLRPHYHAIFFGVHKETLMPLLDDWRQRYGFVKVDNVRIDGNQSAVAKYVGKYCSKGVFENPLVEQGFVMSTFHLMSKGLGKAYLDDKAVQRYFHWPKERKYKVYDLVNPVYSDEFIEFVATGLRMYMDDNIFGYALPRYFKSKLYGTQNNLSLQVADYLLARNDELYCQQLESIQADRHCDAREASYYLAMRQSAELVQREADAKKSLERFYNKSRL